MEEVDQGLHTFGVPFRWFLKSLQPYILKDFSTFGFTSEEEVVFKAQHLYIIYAQSGMLYEILPDAPR
jgi:hypothetical protein